MEEDYIALNNNTKQEFRAILKSTSESGLILGEINENNTGWKTQFSIDDKPLIKLVSPSDINITEKVSANDFLFRLIRDINSNDVSTRIIASEILCYYIEFNSFRIDYQLLEKAVEFMIYRLTIKDEFDVEQKLSEGIFEFIWLGKMDKNSEKELIIKLAKLDKDCLFPYLDDEEYLKFDEVKEFIDKGRKF